MASNFLKMRQHQKNKGKGELESDIYGVLQDVRDIESVIPFMHDSDVGTSISRSSLPLLEIGGDVAKMRDVNSKGNTIKRKVDTDNAFSKQAEDWAKLAFGYKRETVGTTSAINERHRAKR
jgi:hypothetical protein